MSDRKRGEVAPNAFRFMQRDVNVELANTVKAKLDGMPEGDMTEHHAVLNVHVFTHQDDAAVSCRLYQKSEQVNSFILANGEGESTRQIVHSKKVAPEDADFEDAIKMSVDEIRRLEVALFPDMSDDARAELVEAFETAKSLLFPATEQYRDGDC